MTCSYCTNAHRLSGSAPVSGTFRVVPSVQSPLCLRIASTVLCGSSLNLLTKFCNLHLKAYCSYVHNGLENTGGSNPLITCKYNHRIRAVLSDFLHFRSGVTDTFVLLGYDAASLGNLVPDISTLQDETTMSFRSQKPMWRSVTSQEDEDLMQALSYAFIYSLFEVGLNRHVKNRMPVFLTVYFRTLSVSRAIQRRSPGDRWMTNWHTLGRKWVNDELKYTWKEVVAV